MRSYVTSAIACCAILFMLSDFPAKANVGPLHQSNNFSDTLPPKEVHVVGVDLDSDTSNFVRVEKEAGFPGGLEGWRRFLEKNLKADTPVKRKAPVGQYMVVAQFLVEKDGSLSSIQTLTSHGYGMEEEVIRVLNKSPKWKPAIMNGQPVKAYRKQPITFVVYGK